MDWTLTYLIILQYQFLVSAVPDGDGVSTDGIVPNQFIVQIDPDLAMRGVLRDLPGANIAREFYLGPSCRCALLKMPSSDEGVLRDMPKVHYSPNRIVAGFGDTGFGGTGFEGAGVGDKGFEGAGVGDTGFGGEGVGDTGFEDTGVRDTGLGDTGVRDTEVGDTGFGDTGAGDTGFEGEEFRGTAKGGTREGTRSQKSNTVKQGSKKTTQKEKHFEEDSIKGNTGMMNRSQGSIKHNKGSTNNKRGDERSTNKSTNNEEWGTNWRSTNNNVKSTNRDEQSTKKRSINRDEQSTKRASTNRDEKSTINKRSTPSNGASCYKQETGKNYWGLSRISSVDLPHYDSAATNHSYEFSNGGDCVDIYVMDSGVNVRHKTFGGRAVVGYTAFELEKEEGPDDLAGHGTHVAGLAAGRYHGTAKQANIISVKVLDKNKQGKLCWVLEGLEWIAKRLRDTAHLKKHSIINISLGLLDRYKALSFLDDCFRQIPAVVVAAAGNANMNACDVVPARFPTVITVGATTIHDQLMYYSAEVGSNVGPCVDILAPGDEVRSAFIDDNKAERVLSGTSMAAGYVSGVVAIYLNAHNFTETPTSRDLRHLLQGAASKDKINSSVVYTQDLLLHASCGNASSDVVDLTKMSMYSLKCASALDDLADGKDINFRSGDSDTDSLDAESFDAKSGTGKTVTSIYSMLVVLQLLFLSVMGIKL